jgi:UDP-N-acetylglucosamine--N-acetylmuramyl-(pentapeptide) pyrophosphoryl-undecaprenol N-acetylglucosamine transferase
MNKSKIVVMTGGHAGPTAYATIQALKRDNTYSWQITWIGVQGAIEGKRDFTYEYKVFPQLNVKSHWITTGRLQRKFSRYTIPSLVKIPIGIIQAFILILKIKPDVVLSFGGFAAFPVVVSAWLLRIPVVLHEQTAVAGRANIFSSFFAQRIALSRLSSQKYFPKHKTVLTGNPVSDEIKSLANKSKTVPRNIFITGGTRGSKILNESVFEIVPQLVNQYKITHQTGSTSYEQAKHIKKELGDLADNYEVNEFFLPHDWQKAMGEADIVISRAGANIVSELLILKKPSILVPIPFSYLDEQTENAKYLSEKGLSRIINQIDLKGSVLITEIKKLVSDYPQIIQRSQNIDNKLDINASDNLIRLITEVIK